MLQARSPVATAASGGGGGGGGGNTCCRASQRLPLRLLHLLASTGL